MHRLHLLPFKMDSFSLKTYQLLSESNYHLGELKGILDVIPNIHIILKIINLGEAKASSEIENIRTTYNDIFKTMIVSNGSFETTAQDVIRNARATNILYRDVTTNNKISIDNLNNIQELIEPNEKGLRLLPGLKIYNKETSEVIHIPPQDQNIIKDFYKNLEYYINNDLDNHDPLIRMALVHYQFECIHPYKDGNGRTGRILNIMYLINQNRLNFPILNLSKYLKETKMEYYTLLKKCHNDITKIEEFVNYILEGITETVKYTINLIKQLNRLINKTKNEIKKELPYLFSEKLVLHLYTYMYTKNSLFRTSLSISRNTATKYLKDLVEKGFLDEERVGKEVIYHNKEIINIF